MASIAFLEATHPLKHVASDKKSRVQQSICDMLSSILRPLVDEGDPRCGILRGVACLIVRQFCDPFVRLCRAPMIKSCPLKYLVQPDRIGPQ